MHPHQQTAYLSPDVTPIGPHMAGGAYGAFGFGGPQYRDWRHGNKAQKDVASCPPALRQRIERLRRQWEAGKLEWKAMSGKEKRASKDRGNDGLWGKSRQWRNKAETLIARCESGAAALDAGMGAEQDVAALENQTLQLQTALAQGGGIPGGGVGQQAPDLDPKVYLVPLGIVTLGAIGLTAYLVLR